MNVQIRNAAAARAAKFGEKDAAVFLDVRNAPLGVARRKPLPASFRSSLVEVDGKKFNKLEGYASTVDEPYEMYDWAGPYMEIVDRGAFDVTLGESPDVSFLVNHGGLTMARTGSNTLTLDVDDSGLRQVALVNPKRSDVKDLVIAIEDKSITEMSFAFMIVRGKWSPDYTEYRIMQVDLNRGDVSAVNYGANPYTSIEARSVEFLRDLTKLPAGAMREAHHRLGVALGHDGDEFGDRLSQGALARAVAVEGGLKDTVSKTSTTEAAEVRLGKGRSLDEVRGLTYGEGSAFLGDLDKVASELHRNGGTDAGRSTQLIRAQLRASRGE